MWINLILIESGNMIWNKPRVFESQNFNSSSRRDTLCGESQSPELPAGDDASVASQLAATIDECFVMRIVKGKVVSLSQVLPL
jgi:hypothetical protein